MQNARFLVEAYVVVGLLYGGYLVRLLQRARVAERRIDGRAR